MPFTFTSINMLVLVIIGGETRNSSVLPTPVLEQSPSIALFCILTGYQSTSNIVFWTLISLCIVVLLVLWFLRPWKSTCIPRHFLYSISENWYCTNFQATLSGWISLCSLCCGFLLCFSVSHTNSGIINIVVSVRASHSSSQRGETGATQPPSATSLGVASRHVPTSSSCSWPTSGTWKL